MEATGHRALRADAARNAERIVRAAREVYAELGPDAPIDVIACRAGVGERTLYRRFPSKGELIRAAVEQSVAEHLAPAIDQARDNVDPLRGIAELIETATRFGAREHNILTAARRADALSNISAPLERTLNELAQRAKDSGQVRPDLAVEDLPRLVMMLNSVLWTMDPAGDGWRRYVALMLDAISTTGPTELPPAVPIRLSPSPDTWP